MPKVKENRDQMITPRFTKTEIEKLKAEASLFNMPLSTYCRDKLLKGKERNNYYRRNVNTKLVEITKATNDIYDYLARTDSDFVPKTDLIPLIDNIKKGCGDIWNR